MGDRGDLHDAVARLVVAMMVADGRVGTDELDLVGRLDRAGLGPLSCRVHQELDRATRGPIDVDRACATVRAAGVTLAGAVLTMLARMAGVDGSLTPGEQEFFITVARRLGIERDQLHPALEPVRHDPRPAPPRRATFDATAAALHQLGLGRDASSADVDEAYLRLVERYHPGRLAPLGADFVTLAVRELAALTEAYERARSAVRA